jgi:UDP-N-acetylglucosamine--N-acetylmuramyl-(pentapeptide) pyrophosphoryl-undecaprenol N-acetylglucosamine transferase
MKILLVGGGTGGHILPTLAVAKALKASQPTFELMYIGSKRAEDRKLVESAGLKFVGIHAGKLRRYFSFENIADGFRFWLGLIESNRILKKFQPDVVFAKGGYVSLPVVLSAGKLQIPVVVHESDSHLGLANKMALKYASKLAVAWPIQTYWQNESRLSKYADKFVYTGLPIADELRDWQANKLFDNDFPVVLITGGSQGAHTLNVAVWEGLIKLLKNYNLVHQVGSLDMEEANRMKANLAPELESRYLPFEFDRNIFLSGLHTANLVVSRSGSFVFELAVLGKPAILVPLQGSANDHQRKNATMLAKEGIAMMLAPELLNGDVLVNNINQLMENPNQLAELSRKMKEFGRESNGAAEKIAELIIGVVGNE